MSSKTENPLCERCGAKPGLIHVTVIRDRRKTSQHFCDDCALASTLTKPKNHCKTCICGKRAPVQADRRSHDERLKGPGTVAWDEYLDAYSVYSNRNGTSQSAERLVERGGFGYEEITDLLGHEPKTWAPYR